MWTRLWNPIPWLLVALSTAAVCGFLWAAGSAVVVDETGGVVSAVITDNEGSEQRLHQLRSGYFYAIPDLEGTIEVRCRNGMREQWGYVTGFMHTKIRVVGDRPCARIIEES